MQWQTNLPLIAILRGITPDDVTVHVGAVVDAGFDAIEIPLNSPQWEKSISSVVKAYGGRALIGAGTVLKPEQVDQLAGMGCKLVVTPNIQPEVIRRAVSYGMTVCPGCATATEAFAALDAGAQALKFSVIGVWSGLHQRAESGTSAGCSAICRRWRDAGKPGAMD